MKLSETAVLLALLCAPAAAQQPASTSADALGVQSEMQKTLGRVPDFVRNLPAEGVAGAWSETKAILLNQGTQLPQKTKDLIALGVSAQVPCRSCYYFFESLARADGATDRELGEAVAVAGVTQHWSTFLNGSQADETGFRRDVDRIMARAGKQTTRAPSLSPGETLRDVPSSSMPAPASADEAYRDMERELGFVPQFFRDFPKEGIAGAWQEEKGLLMNPRTDLGGKEKELIGLAVAGQIPCRYCSYYHTQAAKQNGATENEIKEALAVAAITRRMSVYAGAQAADEATMRREIDATVESLKRNRTGAPR